MSGEFLLDTSVVIRLLAHDQAVEERLASGVPISVSIVVLGELCFGAYNSNRVQENLAKIEELAARVDVINSDIGTAREYGRIKKELLLKGRPIPTNDIWLAAVARQHALRLVSSDKHFTCVDGLDLEPW